MKKNKVRLTESQLHNVIKESVLKALNEATDPSTDGALMYQWNNSKRRDDFVNKHQERIDKLYNKLGRDPMPSELGVSKSDDNQEKKILNYDLNRNTESPHGQPKYTKLEKVLSDCYDKVQSTYDEMDKIMNLTTDDYHFIDDIIDSLYHYYNICQAKNNPTIKYRRPRRKDHLEFIKQ